MPQNNDFTNEKCNCSTCRIAPYTYEIPDTHSETNRSPEYYKMGVSLD